MFENANIHPTIPVTDLARAREFYEGVLGLSAYRVEEQMSSVIYRVGGGYLAIFQRESASAGHTLAGFDIPAAELDGVLDALLARGLTFDTWDIPGMDDPFDARGVLTMPDGQKGVWFHDPDGNVFSLGTLGLE